MAKNPATSDANERACNVVTHPRFDRPKVIQPYPGQRKGTIRFRRKRTERYRVCVEYKEPERPPPPAYSLEPMHADSRQNAKRFVEALFSKPMLSDVPYEELEKVLQAGGLCVGVSFVDGCGIIMRDVYRSP